MLTQPIAVADRAGRSFPLHAHTHGFARWKSGAVSIEAESERAVTAKVRGQRTRDVILREEKGTLFVHCTCPARTFELPGCKHAWAALLEVDHRGALASLRTTRAPIRVSFMDVPPAPNAKSESSSSPPPSSPSSPSAARSARARRRAKADTAKATLERNPHEKPDVTLDTKSDGNADTTSSAAKDTAKPDAMIVTPHAKADETADAEVNANAMVKADAQLRADVKANADVQAKADAGVEASAKASAKAKAKATEKKEKEKVRKRTGRASGRGAGFGRASLRSARGTSAPPAARGKPRRCPQRSSGRRR